MSSEKAMTLGEFREKSKDLPDNLILFVMRGANLDLCPITAEDWKVFGAEEVSFCNYTVSNENEPGLRISII
jgi:hypothetical protein